MSMTPPRSVRITGWGSYAPELVLTNADLEKLVDTSDEWIQTRTGIRERRVAGSHETTASMSARAGRQAISVAGLDVDDIDLIVVATLTRACRDPGLHRVQGDAHAATAWPRRSSKNSATAASIARPPESPSQRCLISPTSR